MMQETILLAYLLLGVSLMVYSIGLDTIGFFIGKALKSARIL